ncbi:hypothetical protein PVAP13_7NG325448 [Panicum virgatum]|uniref:Uncharacterized protein n=1 Tax=Panicum virgatum TaxID=38727 RepID=A0A8T0QD35_PANVG|nr:hypothetical protein PVAP13_7NG325448 [Panicum virgatum]
MNEYGLEQLVDFVAEHYIWGSKQLCTLWRDLENISCEIKSDEELLDWFLLNLDKGVACINVQMNDFEGALQCSPTKHSLAALSDRSYDTDLAASSDSDDDCSDIEFDPDGEIVDMEDEYDLPDFSYDVDDPLQVSSYTPCYLE